MHFCFVMIDPSEYQIMIKLTSLIFVFFYYLIISTELPLNQLFVCLQA